VTCGNNPHVRVFPDAESLARGIADYFVLRSGEAITSQGRFVVGLPGGATPGRLYSLLVSDLYCKAIAWNNVHVFWTDERCVPRDHPESNYKNASDAFLAQVGVPAGNVHRIKGEEGPDRAAQEYERELREFFGRALVPVFDLVLLGVGVDGHTASLFPGSTVLGEQTLLAAPVFLELPKFSRVTLTLPVLNNAADVVFLASGQTKADIVREIIGHGNEKRYPAGRVQPKHGCVAWYLDNEAAGLLTGHSY
jgi:6-phosphogluconolactonase